MGSVSVEACTRVIDTNADAAHCAPLHIAMLHTEVVSGTHINDPNNGLSGTIYYAKLSDPDTITINGAGNIEIIAVSRPRGAVTAPSVPATTVALRNPFWRHAAVTIAGGTVSAVAVDGTATGVTSGTVIVPSGHTITLTYSSAPAWNWVLL
jgi:hypothetical protein